MQKRRYLLLLIVFKLLLLSFIQTKKHTHIQTHIREWTHECSLLNAFFCYRVVICYRVWKRNLQKLLFVKFWARNRVMQVIKKHSTIYAFHCIIHAVRLLFKNDHHNHREKRKKKKFEWIKNEEQNRCSSVASAIIANNHWKWLIDIDFHNNICNVSQQIQLETQQ